ncbi:unnamed protein product [Citrullus colocynthis]|uniref:Uncharacterized protein n=1 Tax=Citrullus colocynthis TaxID=252529 RepID=A0ABP0Y3V9_9ROSI
MIAMQTSMAGLQQAIEKLTLDVGRMVENQPRTHQEALVGNQTAGNNQNLQQEVQQRLDNQQQMLQRNQDLHRRVQEIPPRTQEPTRLHQRIEDKGVQLPNPVQFHQHMPAYPPFRPMPPNLLGLVSDSSEDEDFVGLQPHYRARMMHPPQRNNPLFQQQIPFEQAQWYGNQDYFRDWQGQPNWRQENDFKMMKIDIPTYNNGKMNIEIFFDWVKSVEIFFDYMEPPKTRRFL